MTDLREPPFDRAEAARRLGVKPSWLRDHRGEVPYRRIGNFVRYTQADLETYIAKHSTTDPLARSTRSKAGAR